jgi:hypothetical protein
MNLPVTHSRTGEPAPTLFQAALGENWHRLPRRVQRLHSGRDVESFSGRACVTRGRGLIPLLAAWLFRFPEEGDDVPLTVTKTRTRRGETWERNFAGRRFRSFLTASPRPSHCRERFGPLTCELELPVKDAALRLPVRRGWLLGIPLPSLLLPGSCSREFAVDDRFHFDVGLYAPLTGGLIVRYRGWLEPDAAPGSDQELND